MKIEYKLSTKDYTSFHYYTIRHLLSGRKVYILVQFIMPLLLALLGLLYGGVLFYILAIGWLIFFSTMFKGLIEHNYKKAFKRFPEYALPMTFELLEDKIIVTSENGTTEHLLSTITNVTIYEGVVFIFKEDKTAILLPLSYLNDNELDIIKGLIK